MGEPLSVMARIEGSTVSHRKIGVFVGRRRGSRPKAGVLTVRAEDWAELRELLKQVPGFELGPPLAAETEGGDGGD